MPIWALKFLPLLRKHWRIIAVAVALCVVFGAGWKVNGWRWESRVESERAARQEAITAAVVQREAELREAFRVQQDAADAVARGLARDLHALRDRNDALQAEIDTAPLTQPLATDVTCTDNETGEIREVQPNPFSGNFVDLWNRAGRVRDDD